MAINRPVPPLQSVGAFEEALIRRQEAGRTVLAMAHERRPQADVRADAEAGPQAYAIYTISVADLANGVPLTEAAQQQGWRYLVVEGNRITAAEVAERDGVHELVRWNYGRFNSQLLSTLVRVVQTAELSGELDPRVLIVPALCICALWLVDQDTQSSNVIPLSPTDPALEAHRMYPADEFVRTLAPVAASRLASPDPA
jgi:hypothetical protein